MKDFLEKIKANKKVLSIAGTIILAIIIVAIIASQVGGSYKKTIKNGVAMYTLHLCCKC